MKLLDLSRLATRTAQFKAISTLNNQVLWLLTTYSSFYTLFVDPPHRHLLNLVFCPNEPCPSIKPTIIPVISTIPLFTFSQVARIRSNLGFMDHFTYAHSLIWTWSSRKKKGKKKGVLKLHGAKLWKIRIMLSLGVRKAVERVRRIQHLLPKRSRKATRPLDTSPDVLC